MRKSDESSKLEKHFAKIHQQQKHSFFLNKTFLTYFFLDAHNK